MVGTAGRGLHDDGMTDWDGLPNDYAFTSGAAVMDAVRNALPKSLASILLWHGHEGLDEGSGSAPRLRRVDGLLNVAPQCLQFVCTNHCDQARLQ